MLQEADVYAVGSIREYSPLTWMAHCCRSSPSQVAAVRPVEAAIRAKRSIKIVVCDSCNQINTDLKMLRLTAHEFRKKRNRKVKETMFGAVNHSFRDSVCANWAQRG
jgi:hypothetical protein